jgi:hypothetical protein
MRSSPPLLASVEEAHHPSCAIRVSPGNYKGWQLNALHVKTCEGLSNSPQMPDSGDDSSDDESKKLFRRLPAHLREQSMQKTYDLLNGGAATAYVPPVGTMPWGSDAREAM